MRSPGEAPPGSRHLGGFRARLLLLVLLPTVAFAGVAGYEAWARYDTSRHAEDVRRAAEAIEAAVAVRAGITQEEGPAQVRLRTSAFGAVGPILAGTLTGIDIAGDGARAIAVDDALLRRLGTDDPQVAAAARALATARAVAGESVGPGDTERMNAAFDAAENAIVAVIRTRVARARLQSLAVRQGDVLDDRGHALASTVDMLDAADLEFLAYWDALNAPRPMPAAVEQRLTIQRTLRRTYLQHATVSAGPAMRTALARVAPDEAVLDEAIEAVLATASDASDATPPRSLQALMRLGPSFGHGLKRQYGYYDIATAAATDLSAEAARAAETARNRFEAMLLAILLVGIGSAGLALLVARSLARPLGQLADDAHAVGAGELPEPLPTRGRPPREIHVVRAAFAEMVASLRALDAQAAALAVRRLDDPSLMTPRPGRLGEHLHGSVDALARSIEEGERLRERLAHAAAHDSLTGLPNRREALAHLDAALERSAADGSAVAVLFIDLDGFKRTNDAHGHAVGDAVLEAAAERLRGAAGRGNLVARLGGDEFLVIAERVEGPAAAEALAARLVDVLAPPIVADGAEVRVGASVGASIGVAGAVAPTDLLREADIAAYRAKAAGKGRHELFGDDLRREIAERADLERAFAIALPAGDITFVYQPIISLDTDRIYGIEALARWNRKGHGPVPPDRFVAIAESSDLVIDLGRHALRRATAQLAAWSEMGGELAESSVFVNISRRHVLGSTLAADVREALDLSGIAPHRLVVEVTERVLIDDELVLAATSLAAVRALGVRVAIDDYGTGYTSLAHLGRLPADVLKIDRSFVQAIDRPQEATLVRLVADAARLLDLTCLAEGVETREQLDALRDVGCDAVQGYLLGRPQPPDDLIAWLDGRAAA